MPTISGLSPEESEALEQYYRAEFKRMLRVAGYTLKNDNLAETAVQETFVTAARKIDSLLSSPNPTGWLYNTLNYTIKQIQRERLASLRRYVALDDAPEPSQDADEPSELDLETNEDLRLFKRYYIEGYSLKELAAELGISVPALKMRMTRARKRLKNDKNILEMKNSEK